MGLGQENSERGGRANRQFGVPGRTALGTGGFAMTGAVMIPELGNTLRNGREVTEQPLDGVRSLRLLGYVLRR